MTMRFQVICGNIGAVYEGNDEDEAGRVFADYCEQSNANHGRAGGESVCVFADGEILREHIGANDAGGE